LQIDGDDEENQQLRSSSMWMDDSNGFVQGQTYNRSKIEKK